VVPHPAGLTFRRLHSRLHGTGAYVISRQTAQRLLALIGAFDMPVDDVLFSPYHPIGRSLRVYQAVPALAIQSNMRPDGAPRPDLKSRLEMERFASRFLNERQRPEPPAAEPPTPWQTMKNAPARTWRRWHEKAFRQRIRIEFGDTP
jgi:GR25 family glycosyltransferase involved in LPS biosynthesis